MLAPIYLDHNASNLIEPGLLERFVGVARSCPGNPGSPHGAGRRARALIEEAREAAAEAFGFPLGGVTFCASGTEALNLALQGLLGPGDHAIASAIEHKAVLETLAALRRDRSVAVSILPVTDMGLVRVDALPGLLRPETKLCAVMAANNEIGTIQPIAALRAALPTTVALLVDGIQAAGRITLLAAAADILVVSAHKLRAPKGAAALLTRPGIEPRSLIYGGSQERGRRAGTEDTAAIAAFGAALRMLQEGALFDPNSLAERRSAFEAALLAAAPGLTIVAREAPRLPQTSAILCPGWTSESLITSLDLEGLQVSSGSACSSGSLLASQVLLALGVHPALARSVLRISFGPETSAADLARAAALIAQRTAARRQGRGEPS